MLTAEEKEKNRRKFQAYLESKHNAALSNLLKNQDFRFYMSEVLGFCKTFENAFNEKGNVAAYNNGLQAAGQKIYNDIMMINPEAYITMCKEEDDILAVRSAMNKEED